MNNPWQFPLALVLPVVIEQLGEDEHVDHGQHHTEQLQEELIVPSFRRRGAKQIRVKFRYLEITHIIVRCQI